MSNYRKRLWRQVEREPPGLAVFPAADRTKGRRNWIPLWKGRGVHAETTVRQRELYSLSESESNVTHWDLDVCHMVLGDFHYKKMSLVRDYNLVINQR